MTIGQITVLNALYPISVFFQSKELREVLARDCIYKIYHADRPC